MAQRAPLRAALCLGAAALAAAQSASPSALPPVLSLGTLEVGARLAAAGIELPPGETRYVSFVQPAVPVSFTATVSSPAGVQAFTLWANVGALFNYTRRLSVDPVAANSRSFTAFANDPSAMGMSGGQVWFLAIESASGESQSVDVSVAREPLPSAAPSPRSMADVAYGGAAQAVPLLPAGSFVYYRFSAPPVDAFTVELAPTAGTNCDLFLTRILPVGANFSVEAASTNTQSALDALVVRPGGVTWSAAGGPYYVRVLAVSSCGYAVRVAPFASPSRSGSATQTTSFSRTQTPTPSSTRSATATPSLSASATATGSWTASITGSTTATHTRTASRTATSSRSSSHTATASSTATSSSSQTASLTSSSTRTSTPSQTATQTRTASRTATQTRTASITASRTSTSSMSSSRTATSSVSSSATSTPSLTASQTRSSTRTSTGSRSSTATNTGSPSQTASSSQTGTGTPSSSQTSTGTPTPSRSSSGTARPTYSPQPSPRQLIPLAYGAGGGVVVDYLSSSRGAVFYSFTAPGGDSFRVELATLRSSRAALGLSSFLSEADFLFNEQAGAQAAPGAPGAIAVNVSDPVLWLASGGPYYLSVSCVTPVCAFALTVLPQPSPTNTPSPTPSATIPSTTASASQSASARPTTATRTQTATGTGTPSPAPSFRALIDLPYGTSPGDLVSLLPKNVAGGGQMLVDYQFYAPPQQGFVVTLSLAPGQFADLWFSTRDRDTYDVRGGGSGTTLRTVTVAWNSTFWRATGGPYFLRVLAYTDLSYTIAVMPLASPTRTPSAAVTRSPLETHSTSKSATVSATRSRSRTPPGTPSHSGTPFPTFSRTKTALGTRSLSPSGSGTRTKRPSSIRTPSRSRTPLSTPLRTSSVTASRKAKLR